MHLSNESLLEFYSKEWARYTKGAFYTDRLFSYLNRYWIKHEKDYGHKGIYNIYTVSFPRAHRWSRGLSLFAYIIARCSLLCYNGGIIFTNLSNRTRQN